MKGATSSTSALTSPQWCMNTTNGHAVNAPTLELPLFNSNPDQWRAPFLPFSAIATKSEPMCIQCGVNPRRSKWSKYCGDLCAGRASYAKLEAEKAARIKAIKESGQLAPSKPLSDVDIEAVSLYTQLGWGCKRIGREQNRDGKCVKDSLIRAGVYNPDTKHNGTAKKGHGAGSRNPNEDEIARRDRVKHEKERMRRVDAANILRLMRKHNYKATRAAKILGITRVPWHTITQSKAYGILKERVRKSELNTWKESRKSSTMVSLLFPYEKDFEKHVFGLLKHNGIKFDDSPDPVLDSYPDIETHTTIIELKVDVRPKPMCRCIGQLTKYRTAGKRVILCIPEDIVIPEGTKKILDGLCITTSSTQLCSYLTGVLS